MQLAPYLSFDGRCEEAFRFYAEALGGTVTFMQTFGDSPMAGETPPGWHAKVMHATLTLGSQTVMGSDAPPDQYQAPQGLYVSIGLTDAAAGERIFAALAEGGAIHVPYSKTFWSPGFGMVVDRFGIPWMVNVEGEPA
jgi:PhnB protein